MKANDHEKETLDATGHEEAEEGNPGIEAGTGAGVVGEPSGPGHASQQPEEKRPVR